MHYKFKIIDNIFCGEVPMLTYHSSNKKEQHLKVNRSGVRKVDLIRDKTSCLMQTGLELDKNNTFRMLPPIKNRLKSAHNYIFTYIGISSKVGSHCIVHSYFFY